MFFACCLVGFVACFLFACLLLLLFVIVVVVLFWGVNLFFLLLFFFFFFSSDFSLATQSAQEGYQRRLRGN